MRCSLRVLAVLALPLFWVSGVNGSVIAPSPNLPPAGSEYVSPAQAHQLYNAGALSVEVFNIKHAGFSLSTPPPQNVGNSVLDSFSSTLEGDLSLNGGPASHFFGSALVSVQVTKAAGPNGSPLGNFNTEMLQLDISGLPGGALIRESPTLASLGQTTIADAGGGLFQISSFFDIFTELSLDGGQTWIPSTGSGHVDLVPGPEPSALVTCAIGAMVCAGSLAARRVRRSRKV